MFLSGGFFAAGSGGPVTPLPGGTASADVPGNQPATAGWRFNSDGTVDRRTEAGWTLAVHSWYSPTQAAIGASYQMRASVLSGSTPDTGVYGSWQVMSGSLTFTDTVVASSNLADLDIEISTDGTDPGVVTSGIYTIDVLSEP